MRRATEPGLMVSKSFRASDSRNELWGTTGFQFSPVPGCRCIYGYIHTHTYIYMYGLGVISDALLVLR